MKEILIHLYVCILFLCFNMHLPACKSMHIYAHMITHAECVLDMTFSKNLLQDFLFILRVLGFIFKSFIICFNYHLFNQPNIVCIAGNVI